MAAGGLPCHLFQAVGWDPISSGSRRDFTENPGDGEIRQLHCCSLPCEGQTGSCSWQGSQRGRHAGALHPPVSESGPHALCAGAGAGRPNFAGPIVSPSLQRRTEPFANAETGCAFPGRTAWQTSTAPRDPQRRRGAARTLQREKSRRGLCPTPACSALPRLGTEAPAPRSPGRLPGRLSASGAAGQAGLLRRFRRFRAGSSLPAGLLPRLGGSLPRGTPAASLQPSRRTPTGLGRGDAWRRTPARFRRPGRRSGEGATSDCGVGMGLVYCGFHGASKEQSPLCARSARGQLVPAPRSLQPKSLAQRKGERGGGQRRGGALTPPPLSPLAAEALLHSFLRVAFTSSSLQRCRQTGALQSASHQAQRPATRGGRDSPPQAPRAGSRGRPSL